MYNAEGRLTITLPTPIELRRPEMLTLKRADIQAAIQDNPADSQYYWSAHLNLETGDILNISNTTPDHHITEALVPLPSMDPEGSGQELERFQEFTENPPDGIEIETYNNYDEDRDAYFGYAESAGWHTVQKDWEESEAAHCDFLIDEFVDGLKTGNLEICHNFEGCSPTEVELQ